MMSQMIILTQDEVKEILEAFPPYSSETSDQIYLNHYKNRDELLLNKMVEMTMKRRAL